MNKKQLKQKCADLGIDTQDLTTNTQLKKAIAAKEAELASQVEVEETETVTETVETVTESPKVETESPETVTESSETVTENLPGEGDQLGTKEEEESEEVEFPTVYTDNRGRKWAFKSTAPKQLNIDGHPMSQEEILETEEVISELVYGNCSFLTQLKD